jgi:hypothetical protein
MLLKNIGHKKTFRLWKVLNNFSAKNYMLTVVAFALSLQHAFVAVASFDDFEQPAVLASDLVQQVFPLAHFFFFPLSAIATPVTNKNAVANKSTFFMIIMFN